jgi:tetratricopeptide (TPR) repeat protein
MIIDNADDFDMFFDPKNTNKVVGPKLAGYIPDCPHGSVLVTTRDKKVAVRICKNISPLSLINVLPMGKAEAADLVYQVLAGEDYSDEDVRQLTQSLEYIPLAITQAAAFILENCISIPIYIQRYMDNKDDAIELLSHDFEALGRDDETHNAITTTWMLSFKQIRDQNSYAADILSLMAFLDRHCIPEELLRKYREPNSSTDFEKACGTLKAFSLVEENTMTIAGKPHRSFSMHRMVQLVTRQWLVHHHESTIWADNSLIVVSKVFPPGERENWDRCEVYLPQVQMVLESNDGSEAGAEFKADLLHNASSYFRVKGYHGRAEQVGREAVEMRQKLLGSSHPDTILSLTSLSRIHMEQGRLDDAIKVQQSAVTQTMLNTKEEVGENIHAKNHIEANLHATRHLAAIYGIQGQYEKAEKLELQVVDESKRLLGENHPDTLLAMRDLGVTYGCLGRPDEAKPLHQHVLKLRKQILGDDHPETLISMSDLAITYCQQDPLKNASKVELLMCFVVEARKRILGNQHPNTLQAMRDLAIVYELQNRDDEVESIKSEILEESLRAQNMRDASFRAMSDGIVTYQQQSLNEVVHKVIGDNWRSMRSRPNTKTPKINFLISADEVSAKSEASVSIKSSKLNVPDEDTLSVKEVGRPRWHRRLLSFDGHRRKDL